MTPQLNSLMFRARQLEIAASTARPHTDCELSTIVDRPSRRSVSRMRAAALGLGLSLALAGTGVATASSGVAHSSAAQRNLHSAQRRELRISRLQSEGYQQASCTLSGTLMVNQLTHSSVIVGE